MGEEGGFDAVAVQRYPQVETINHVHTAGNSSGIVDGSAAVLVGSKRFGGKGPILDDLEWDVKIYLALGGALHDVTREAGDDAREHPHTGKDGGGLEA